MQASDSVDITRNGIGSEFWIKAGPALSESLLASEVSLPRQAARQNLIRRQPGFRDPPRCDRALFKQMTGHFSRALLP